MMLVSYGYHQFTKNLSRTNNWKNFEIDPFDFILKSLRNHTHYSIELFPASALKFSSISHNRKFTPYSKFIVTLVPPKPQFPFSAFLDILAPIHLPITKKDSDYYIFLSPPAEKPIDILSHPEIRNTLKFKLVVTPNAKLFSLCIYCSFPTETVVSIPTNNFTLSSLFPDFTSDMLGFNLRVGGPTKYYSVFEVKKITNGTFDKAPQYKFMRGLYIETFYLVQQKLNFTYTFHPCYAFGKIKEGKTGTLLKNGTWVGCVGDLLAGRADFAVATSAVDQDRYQVVEYLTPLCYNYIMFFTHKPFIKYSWKTPFRAFDEITWSLVLSVTWVVGLITYLFENQLSGLLFGKTNPEMVSIQFALFYLNLYGNVMRQPITIVPRGIPSKLNFAVWLFYGIVIGCAYESSFKALIISPGVTPVASSIGELANPKLDYEWGASVGFRSGLAEEVFKHSKTREIKHIYRNLQTEKNVMECLRKAAISNYACFHWDVMAGFGMNTEFVARSGNKYPFLYAKDSVMFLPRTWSVRKREIFRHQFNFVSGQSFETGLWQEIMRRDEWAVRKAMLEKVEKGLRKPLLGSLLIHLAKGDSGDSPQPYNFRQLKAGFVIHASGLTLASLVFFCERLWNFGGKLWIKLVSLCDNNKFNKSPVDRFDSDTVSETRNNLWDTQFSNYQNDYFGR